MNDRMDIEDIIEALDKLNDDSTPQEVDAVIILLFTPF